jgi:hypothetical protein
VLLTLRSLLIRTESHLRLTPLLGGATDAASCSRPGPWTAVNKPASFTYMTVRF